MRTVPRRASTGAPWAHHCVYVALLSGVPGDPRFSYYVGMTGLSPEDRYQRHLAGVQAVRKRIKRHGLGLLPDLYERFNPMSDPDAREVERELGQALSSAGFAVHWA